MKGRRNVLKIMTLGVGLAVGLVLASKVCFEKTFDDFYKDAKPWNLTAYTGSIPKSPEEWPRR